jgi:hypothetical protein
MRLLFVAIFTVSLPGGAFAQKLVDPSTVAPEYRAAAEKRRDEQLRQIFCAKQAQEDKVLRRDFTAYLERCLETLKPK